MKATGIVRRIDDLGRIVIPREIRQNLKIKDGSPLEIFITKEGEIVLKRYNYTNERDWVKAKAIIRALYPNLQFALYDDWGNKQTATNVSFPQSIEFESFDNREIKNSERDIIGYIEISGDIPAEDFSKITKVLTEFFSEF